MVGLLDVFEAYWVVIDDVSENERGCVQAPRLDFKSFCYGIGICLTGLGFIVSAY